MVRRLHRLMSGLLTLSLSCYGVCAPITQVSDIEAPALQAQSNSAADLTWVRLDGATRFDTMRSIVRESFQTAEWAVIASGENYPDALAASSLAGALQCPVLITAAKNLAPQTRTELERLKVKHVYLIGGASALSDDVAKALTKMGVENTRLAGADRAGTSLAVANELTRLQGDGHVSKHADTVIVTTGATFTGALAISPYAYAQAAPIMLTDEGGALSSAQVEAIQGDSHVSRVVIVCPDGFTGAIVEGQLAGSTQVVRLEGQGASGLSANVAEWELTHGLSYQTPVVTRASVFPDALCGSALAGTRNSVMLLIDDLADQGWETLGGYAPIVKSAYVLGGMQATPLVWSGDAELDAIVDSLVAGRTADDPNVLRDVYEYISTLTYADMDVYPEGDWRTWSVPYAKEIHKTGAGNCYRFSSLMAWVCRRLGYAAYPVSGNTYSSAGEVVPHCWVELTDAGRTLILDPERHRWMKDYDFFMVTYAEAPIYYLDLNGNALA